MPGSPAALGVKVYLRLRAEDVDLILGPRALADEAGDGLRLIERIREQERAGERFRGRAEEEASPCGRRIERGERGRGPGRPLSAKKAQPAHAQRRAERQGREGLQEVVREKEEARANAQEGSRQPERRQQIRVDAIFGEVFAAAGA